MVQVPLHPLCLASAHVGHELHCAQLPSRHDLQPERTGVRSAPGECCLQHQHLTEACQQTCSAQQRFMPHQARLLHCICTSGLEQVHAARSAGAADSNFNTADAESAHLGNALGEPLSSGVPHNVVGVLVVVKQLQHASCIKGQEGDALHLHSRICFLARMLRGTPGWDILLRLLQ